MIANCEVKILLRDVFHGITTVIRISFFKKAFSECVQNESLKKSFKAHFYYFLELLTAGLVLITQSANLHAKHIMERVQ